MIKKNGGVILPQASTWDRTASVTRALGCDRCPYRETCGGLHLERGAFDCLSYCQCEDPARCSFVCPRNPNVLVPRIVEVNGFSLDNVPRAPILAMPDLPDAIPILERRKRAKNYNGQAVAISLFNLYRVRDGKLTIRSERELAEHFHIAEGTPIVATGVGRDWRVESWWPFGTDAHQLEAWAKLGLRLVTVPNFSMFSDVPRPDNLHAMKRIALCWAALVNAGIPAALHVNARTEYDYQRWTDFIANRPEVNVLAFEFGTGCGDATRIHFHVDQLALLARAVGRPLMLVVRGGTRVLLKLREVFARVVVLDTQAYHRARSRRRAVLSVDRKLRWTPAYTAKGEPIDEILTHNIATMQDYLNNPPQVSAASSIRLRRVSGSAAQDRDGDPGQGSLLPNLKLPLLGSPAA